jgi:hypothetical protein
MQIHTQSIEKISAPLFTQRDRIGHLMTMVAALATLSLARLLEPSSNGVGTHMQLGLPPCLFLHFTGLPCPTCGFTTCFALGARFHLFEAIVTQPFGFLVFCMTIVSIPVSALLIYRRIAWTRLLCMRETNIAIYVLLALFMLGWLYKIIIMKSVY